MIIMIALRLRLVVMSLIIVMTADDDENVDDGKGHDDAHRRHRDL
jgi:hypothetical protein